MFIGKREKRKVLYWLERRLHISALIDIAQHKRVPVHKHSVWYYFGGISLLFLMVQIVTGILLMVYYVPELASAHASILKINSGVEFGWFIRSLHSWGANLMILAVFVHFFSAYFMKAYRKPRELTWLTGVALLVICLGFGFTGYLLPWDEVSFFATKIGLDISSKIPVFGEIMASMLRGGTSIGQPTLSRFFTIHVSVLPVMLMGLLSIHLAIVQAHGMSEPSDFIEQKEEEKKYEPFFPDFFFKDILVWILAGNLLFGLTMLAPWGIGPEADPFAAAPIGIKPEWYFLAMFQFLKLVPPMIGPIEGELFGILLMTIFAGILALVPFWDTGESKLKSNLATGLGVITLLFMVVFSVWGAMS